MMSAANKRGVQDESVAIFNYSILQLLGLLSGILAIGLIFPNTFVSAAEFSLSYSKPAAVPGKLPGASSSLNTRPDGNFAKDLFLIQLKHQDKVLNNGFMYTLELHRPNQAPVICNAGTTEFYSGDGIKLRINSNFRAHAYIVLTRGSSGKQTVLYPPPAAPQTNTIEPGIECVIPPKGVIRFDQNPGVERLLFILSRHPIDLKKVMSTESGVPIADNSALNSGIEGIVISNDLSPTSNLASTYVVKSDPAKVVYVELALNHLSVPALPVSSTSGTQPPVSPPSVSVAPVIPAPTSSPTTIPPSTISPTTIPSASPSVISTSTASSPALPVTAPVIGGTAPPAVVAPVTSTTRTQINRPVTDKWAVVVALSKYKESHMNLKAPKKDAEAFANFLIEDAGFAPSHVLRIYDKEATRLNIMDTLEQLGQRVRPDDLFVFYANCHGSTTTSRGENYLLLWDWTGSYKRQLLMQELSSTLKEKVHSERIVVIVQACHSGYVKDAARLSPEAVTSDLQGIGRIVASACTGEESSWVYSSGGIFTRALIPNLRKYPRLKEALTHTRNDVIEATESERESRQMHPVIKYDLWLGDDAVLMAKPTDPQP